VPVTVVPATGAPAAVVPVTGVRESG